jgi:hypothetical protein
MFRVMSQLMGFLIHILNCCADDKYPSEEVRTDLSKKIGLSEKQLQVWFKHRRHKDRRDGIDDDKLTLYASRHKADADSEELPSTKRGEIDLNSREDDKSEDGYPAAVLAEEQDDDVLIVKKMNGIDVNEGDFEEFEKPKATTKKKIASGLKEQPRKPPRKPASPKSKVISNVDSLELAAVKAVESQLNGPLREDGPPLGFEFDSPPPGAFEEFMSTEGNDFQEPYSFPSNLLYVVADYVTTSISRRNTLGNGKFYT